MCGYLKPSISLVNWKCKRERIVSTLEPSIPHFVQKLWYFTNAAAAGVTARTYYMWYFIPSHIPAVLIPVFDGPRRPSAVQVRFYIFLFLFYIFWTWGNLTWCLRCCISFPVGRHQKRPLIYNTQVYLVIFLCLYCYVVYISKCILHAQNKTILMAFSVGSHLMCVYLYSGALFL